MDLTHTAIHPAFRIPEPRSALDPSRLSGPQTTRPLEIPAWPRRRIHTPVAECCPMRNPFGRIHAKRAPVLGNFGRLLIIDELSICR